MTALLPSAFPSIHSSTKSNPYETSPSGETATSPHSSVRNTFLMTSQVPTMTMSTDSTPGTTEETSTTGSKNTALVTLAGSITATLEGQSTVTSLRTSNQEIPASSQNHQTHGTETTREAQTTTLTQMSTSPLSSSPSVHNVTATASQETAPLGETTTSSPASVTNTPMMTPKMTTFTDSTLGNIGETSTPVTESLRPVTSAVSVTGESEGQSTETSSRSSIQDTTAFSQNQQTQSTETTRESQTSTLTQMITSPLSSSPRVHNVTGTVAQETSPPAEKTSSSLFSVSNTPMISKTRTMTTFTESTFNNTEETSTPATKSPTPVPSAASVTAEPEGQSTAVSLKTSAQDISAFSQNHQTQSMETTGESQTSAVMKMSTLTLSSFPSVHNAAGAVSQETFPSGEATTSSSSSVGSTPIMTSKTITMTAFKDSTFNNTEETSTPGTVSSTPVPSAASITAEPEGQSTATASRTSTLDTSAFSQNHQTQSMETTREAQTSTLPQRTTSTPSFSPSVLNVTDTVSQEISPPDEKTTSFPFSVSNTPILTSKIVTMTTFAESTFNNTEETMPFTESLRPVTSAVSIKGEPEGQPPENSSRSTIQDTTAFSQNHQTQSLETTRESLTTTLTPMPTSTLFHSPRVHNATWTVSQETSTPGERTTSSPSSFSNAPVMTSKDITMTTSTDPTLGNTGETSTPLTGSLMPVTSVFSPTEPEGQSSANSLRTSTQDTSAFSQNHQSQSMETTRDAQTSTLSQRTMSTLSSSPSVLNETDTVPQEISHPGEMTTSFPSSVSNTPIMKSKTITVTTFTESTSNITEETSTPGTRSSTPVPSAASITAEPEGQSTAASSRTSIWDTSTSSQNYQTQSTETTRESQTSILTQMITSTPSFSPSVHNVTGTVSEDTSSPGETATSSLSSVTNIPMMISKTITMTTFTNSTLGNTVKTSTPLTEITETLMPVTSASSITAEPGQSLTTSSRTFNQDTTAFSQNHQNQNTETTRDAPTSTLLQRTTPTPSSSTSIYNVAGTVAEETSLSGEKTTSSSSSVSNTSMMTSKVMTMTTFTESTPKNTEETATPGTKIPTTVTSAASLTAEPEGQSTATSSRTSTLDTSASSQNHQTQSTEITIEAQTSTLPQMSTSTLSSPPSAHNVTTTVSQDTSPPGETTASFLSSVTMTSKIIPMTTSTDSTVGNTVKTSTPLTGNLMPVTSASSIPAEPEGQSPATSSRTSASDTTGFSQNHQSQSTETTIASDTDTLTQRPTLSLSSSPGVLNVTKTVSWETSPSDEMTTSFPSSVSNTLMMTSTMSSSTDSTLKNAEEISTPGTKIPSLITSATSITAEPEGESPATASGFSTQDPAVFSQNHQTQSMESTRESQTSILTQRTTSTLSPSPRVLNVTESVSWETSPPDEMSTSSPYSVTNTPMMTSKTITMTTSTKSTLGNPEETSTPGTKSSTSVNSTVSITAEPEGQSRTTSSRTSIQDTSASSQNHQIQSTETTRESQTSTFTQMSTSTLSSSPSVHNVTTTVSQDTSPDETTASFLSSVTDTSMMTSKVITMATSTDTTLENTVETSTPLTGNLMPVTSASSITAEPEGQSSATSSRMSTQDTIAFSQNHQTQSTETTRDAQTSTLPQRNTSTLSSSTSVLNVTETVSWETSRPDEMTTSFPSSVTNTPKMTSKTITMTTSTDSTLGNTEDTSTPGTKSPVSVTSAASITAETKGQSIASSSKASTQDISAFSQNHQTQSTDTTRESRTTTVTGVVTSAPLTSPHRHTLTGSSSQETAHPDEMTTTSLSSFSNTSVMTSKVIKRTTSTDSTLGNTGETSVPVIGSLMPVTSVASITVEPEGESPATFSRTSTQYTTAFPQNQHTQSMGTTRVPQINTLTPGASTILSSPSGFNPSGTVSQETLPSGETTTSSPSSVSNTFLVTSEVFRMPTSTDSTLGNTEETSLSVSGTISAITSKVSTTWWSDTLSTALSPSSLPPKLSTAFHTHLSEGAETIGWPHERSSVSPSVSHETFTPHETTLTSFSSEGHTTWLSKELPSTPTSATTMLVTGSPSTWTAGTIPGVPSEVSTIGEPGQPTTHPSHSTTVPETTGAGAQTQWTQEMGTTGEVFVHSPRYSVTQMTKKATSPSSSPMLDGHTSQQITMAPSTYHSTIHPVSTSPQKSSAASQRRHTPAPKTTRESQTTRSISPVTDSLKTATTPASSFTAGRDSPSEIVPQEASTVSAATTFTPAPTRDGHTTQAPTTALQAAPSSPDTTLGPSGGTLLSITGTIPLATSVVSTPGGAGGRWTSASASTSPNTAPAMTQTHQAPGTEASGETQTSQPASSGSGTIAAGTATPSSFRTSGTTPSGSEGMPTSGGTTRFSPSPSRDTDDPQSTSELPSASASPDATPGSAGTVSPSASPDATPASAGTGSPSASPEATLTTAGTGSPSASPDATPGSAGTASPSASPDATPASAGTGSPSASPDTTPASAGTGSASTHPSARSTHRSSSRGHSGATRSTPTPRVSPSTCPSVQTAPEASSASQHPESAFPTPQPSGDAASSGYTSPARTTGSFSSSGGHSSLSPAAPGPAAASSSATLFTGRATPLPAASASSASPVSSGPTLGTETLGSCRLPSFFSPRDPLGSVQPEECLERWGIAWDDDALPEDRQREKHSLPNRRLRHPQHLHGHPTHGCPRPHPVRERDVGPGAEEHLGREEGGSSWNKGVEGMAVKGLQVLHGEGIANAFGVSENEKKRSKTCGWRAGNPVGVSLLPYGSGAGDLEFVRRTVDFTSPLFKPPTGFPFGSSLRDSLYFTDNGQIIFPESDYQIFSYPNPLPRGFTGWDPVALVAPFWDDADFSNGQGTIFYQEYETLYGEHNLIVLQAESWIRKITNNGGYKARWTLKVTWVGAHTYPAQWSLGTNTYQAILSTDGSRSYALFLYQSGGMQWDAAQHAGSLVLMGFSSGDGYFENSPLMLQPVWEKYRPDRLLNSNLGLRGLQFYRLHREERPNYRLTCLQWLRSQPQRPSWGWNQVSCPCSWQQGRWDLRFRPVSIGDTSFPPSLGLSETGLVSGRWAPSSRQLCSFTSWQGGVCCSYGPWGELLEGWHVQSPRQFGAQELEPQSWCCRWNHKPDLCALYRQRRPRVGCAAYRPPRSGWMFGDPHITTLDGVNYTFNGLGDFLLVQAQDGNSSFQLQGRTAQTGSAQATNFIAFAAQYHSRSLDTIMVQWLLEPHDRIRVLLDNQNVTFEPDHEDDGGSETFSAPGVLLSRSGLAVSASFDGSVTVSVTALSSILHASASLPQEYWNRTEGLLGIWNNNPEDDLRMPNGSTIPLSSSEATLFHYGMTWEINGTGLLGKRNDQLPSNFTPVFYDQLQTNSSWDEDLISNCNGDRSCIYDALATRSTSIGLHTLLLHKTYEQVNATFNQFPPSIEGSRVVEAYKGQTMLIQYTSNAENVTFMLRDNCTDLKLFENGTLLWTPKSLKPFSLEILARSAKTGLSSALQPRTVVCHCSAKSQCLYNQTSRVGSSSLEVAGCKCDRGTFGHYCERSADACEEPCFPNVSCVPGKGCEACPPNLTGDGRHCAALGSSSLCRNQSCPVNYCYNQGHCYISQALGCRPSCTCPPAFTDSRCLLAGNNFTPTVSLEPPLRVIQLLLSEKENASMADVNTSVAYRLRTLHVRAFLYNSEVNQINSPALASGSPVQYWMVTSQFQYRPQGPVIHFLNNQLLAAVVEAFLHQHVPWRSEEPRNDVVFQPLSREDVRNVMALNVSMLRAYFKCSGYEGYDLVYGPQSGFTCVSLCSRGYCDHGGQCQHPPSGPRCSCVSFSIYTAWGERCEHLSMKLEAFFGIFFGALGALLLLGFGTFVVLHFWGCSRTRFSYLLDSES
ncbi:Mucin-4 [Plecturocebus cupreus]